MNGFKDGFTLVIVPRRAAKVIRITLSRRNMLLLAAGAVAVVTLAGASLFRATDLQVQLAGYDRLRDSYLRQKVEIRRVGEEVDQFKDALANMRELDYKLRQLTSLGTDRARSAQLGVGGTGTQKAPEPLKDADLKNLDVLGLLDKDLAQAKQNLDFQEQSFNNLKGFLSDRKDLIERSPYRWPVRGFIASGFGNRLDPFTGQMRMHDAIDIVAPKGTPVRATADGIVTNIGWDANLGNVIVIDHGYGVTTRYGHNDSLLVREGQRVKRGDIIATVGTTGRSTGPHLHYEVRVNDVPVNPLSMIIE